MTLPEHLTWENTAAIGVNVVVYFDGVQVHDIIEAHTGEGWLIRARHNVAGLVFADGDEIATETLHGLVTAEIA